MTNNKQQTAVDYLVEQLFPKALSAEQYYHIQQAKELEKEQYKGTWFDGVNSAFSKKLVSFDDYYNKTYGGDQQ